jgi:hypothetical protein
MERCITLKISGQWTRHHYMNSTKWKVGRVISCLINLIYYYICLDKCTATALSVSSLWVTGRMIWTKRPGSKYYFKETWSFCLPRFRHWNISTWTVWHCNSKTPVKMDHVTLRPLKYQTPDFTSNGISRWTNCHTNFSTPPPPPLLGL